MTAAYMFYYVFFKALFTFLFEKEKAEIAFSYSILLFIRSYNEGRKSKRFWTSIYGNLISVNSFRKMKNCAPLSFNLWLIFTVYEIPIQNRTEQNMLKKIQPIRNTESHNTNILI